MTFEEKCKIFFSKRECFKQKLALVLMLFLSMDTTWILCGESITVWSGAAMAITFVITTVVWMILCLAMLASYFEVKSLMDFYMLLNRIVNDELDKEDKKK